MGGVLKRQIVVVGSGSFARSVCYGLATELRTPADVLVLARDPAKAAEVAFVAATRAGVSAVPATFRAAALTADLDDLLGSAEPEVLVQAVSRHSPWEEPSAWTRFIAAAGFGVTVPLQADLVLDVAEALSRVAPGCLLINACFPDAVNPVLRESNLPIFCGVGNISSIAASVRAADVQLLAHHTHLHQPADPADEARLWLGGVERQDVAELLAPVRSVKGAELNQIGGHAAARLVADVLAGSSVETHVPGPLGLPGGYPVKITGERLALRLPAGIDADTAIAWNHRISALDGVQVRDGRVSFPPRTAEVLKAHLPVLADGYPVRDIRAACAELLELRAHLRGSSH